MPSNMYDYTVPALLRGLGVLQSYLDKMQAAVDAGQFTAGELLQARLADDMLPLGRQFQIASDNAKNGPARLTGREAPWFADNEQSIGEYRDRIDRTIAFLRTLKPEAFEGSHARMIDQSYRRVGAAMAGDDYLRALLLPNFYFHVAVAHSILRHKGIRLGKSDYLGVLLGTSPATLGSSREGHTARFLTQAESIDWLAGRGLQEVPAADAPGRSSFQFDLQPLPVRLSDLIGSLLEDLGEFEGAAAPERLDLGRRIRGRSDGAVSPGTERRPATERSTRAAPGRIGARGCGRAVGLARRTQVDGAILFFVRRRGPADRRGRPCTRSHRQPGSGTSCAVSTRRIRQRRPACLKTTLSPISRGNCGARASFKWMDPDAGPVAKRQLQRKGSWPATTRPIGSDHESA
ncbi:MAG TPA: DUF1993 domain-containing protein [Frateuria sp.]|uniref:DUF1993 domain-containing protein n=1 Tax=Frateuria sp. TaxID=2211372 RepID=UPI002D7E31A0|nr:DUF1993 domain-containing protein [Frateuria sp.]HET6803986.1 DUF1993 domain-containing protein [Frateuria sp.]